MLTLRNVPNPTNVDFWEDRRRETDISLNIIKWPADDGAKLAIVRVGLMALGDYDGQPLGINSAEIEKALSRHRDLIQELARKKYKPGDSDVTIDAGDFPPPLPPMLPLPTSGRVSVGNLSGREFLVECAGMNREDYERLMGFFNQMQGRFRSFRFERGTINYPHCHFGSDELPTAQTSPDSYGVRFSVKVAQ